MNPVKQVTFEPDSDPSESVDILTPDLISGSFEYTPINIIFASVIVIVICICVVLYRYVRSHRVRRRQ